MAEEYWSISEICFTKRQMRWLTDHITELRDGDWPLKPGTYVKTPKQACKSAKEKGYSGICLACPFRPCLEPGSRTPLRIRKERNENRVLEIAAEVDARLELVLNYISGWKRPDYRIYRHKRDGVEFKKLPRQ